MTKIHLIQIKQKSDWDLKLVPSQEIKKCTCIFQISFVFRVLLAITQNAQESE